MKGKKKKVRQVSKRKQENNQNTLVLFTERELDEIKSKLLEMRQQIIDSLKARKNRDMKEAEIGDIIDEATSSLEKEVLFELSDSEKQNLESIEAALRKIENKKYGICESCNKPIDKKRLKVLPQSRYCALCQSSSERLG